MNFKGTAKTILVFIVCHPALHAAQSVAESDGRLNVIDRWLGSRLSRHELPQSTLDVVGQNPRLRRNSLSATSIAEVAVIRTSIELRYLLNASPSSSSIHAW